MYIHRIYIQMGKLKKNNYFIFFFLTDGTLMAAAFTSAVQSRPSGALRHNVHVEAEKPKHCSIH